MRSAPRCALATPHRLATEAGVAAFERGGNAIDAALAASAVLAVVYPHMCSIGGDVMALVALPEREIAAINGSGAAGLATPVESLREEVGEVPLVGPIPITVPGGVAAWESIAALGGRLSLSDLLQPSIELASEGVPVARSLARALRSMPHVFSDAGMAGILSVNGAPLAEGEVLRQPALARSLQAIASDGPAALYRGEVGARLTARLRALGAPLAAEDLQRHATEIVAPIESSFGDLEVLTSPPNSQGFVLVEILNALAHVDDVPDPLGEDVALLVQLCRLAALDRDRYLADPRYADVPLQELLSEAHGAELLAAARAHFDSVPATGSAIPKGDTVAVVAGDGEGNAASVIQSVFHTFGAGILEPETGILLHNRGASFSLDPDSPNVLAPGKRPLHTLMPVMMRRGPDLVGVQGAMGGKAQPQIHLQLLLRMLRGESPTAALDAPRWVVGGLEEGQARDVVYVERSAGEKVANAITRTGMTVKELEDRHEDVGHGQVVFLEANGGLEASSDPRADGSAAVASI
jgi:oxamate amidohydrolase